MKEKSIRKKRYIATLMPDFKTVWLIPRNVNSSDVYLNKLGRIKKIIGQFILTAKELDTSKLEFKKKVSFDDLKKALKDSTFDDIEFKLDNFIAEAIYGKTASTGLRDTADKISVEKIFKMFISKAKKTLPFNVFEIDYTAVPRYDRYFCEPLNIVKRFRVTKAATSLDLILAKTTHASGAEKLYMRIYNIINPSQPILITDIYADEMSAEDANMAIKRFFTIFK